VCVCVLHLACQVSFPAFLPVLRLLFYTPLTYTMTKTLPYKIEYTPLCEYTPLPEHTPLFGKKQTCQQFK